MYYTKKWLKKHKDKIKPIDLKRLALKVYNRKLDDRVFFVNTSDTLKI